MITIAYDHQIFSAQQYGGVSRYFCELAARADRASGFASKVIAPIHFNGFLAEHTGPKLALYLPMRVPKTARVYRAFNAGLSSLVMLAEPPHILHRTYYAQGRRPRGSKIVVTVFDMIHELYPHYFSSNDRTTTLKRRAISEADAVLCISQSTADDLQRLFAVPSEKIAVTHLGFSDAFARVVAHVGTASASTRPYLLFVGDRSGHKNFKRLLAAYGASSSLTRDFDLIAFGGSPFDADELVRIEALRLRRGAVRRAAGSDLRLADAYAGAHALVYPSEYEGFGIPPLEAMSAGCPTVCSNVSSIPEVVADAGAYFDPLDIDSMRTAIERVAYGDDDRATLIERGRRRCLDFSWERCTKETLEVYRRLHP